MTELKMSEEELKQVTNRIQTCNLEESLDYEMELTDEEDGELPNIVIVTGVADSVFDEERSKVQFEDAFRSFCSPDSGAGFHYLKSFRRARVVYEQSMDSARARIQMHEAEVCGKRIKCFFAQPIGGNKTSEPHLRPPTPEKQFLISPPASPPVGWEPRYETVPVVDYDLISALANLAPGEAHTLHQQAEGMPGIVVHICEDPDNYQQRPPSILQTRCPERKS